MAEDLKDILNHLNKETDQETLLKYLRGQLQPGEQHRVEENLLNDAFENDAVEGLSEIDQVKMQLMADALNRALKKKTAKKNQRRRSRALKPPWWLYFSVLILLIIIVLIYLYLYRSLGA